MDEQKVEEVVKTRLLGQAPRPVSNLEGASRVPGKEPRFETPRQATKLTLGIHDGQIVLAFNKVVQAITFSEPEARNLARALRSLADKVRAPDRVKRHKRKR